MDNNSCLEGWCCSWCQQSRQYNVIQTGKQDIDLAACCGSFIVDYFCSGIGSMILAYMNREALRRRYNLQGDGCNDCLVAVFCTTCVACQNYREMSMHSEWPSGECVSQPFAHPTLPLQPAPPRLQVMGNQQQQQQQQPYGQQPPRQQQQQTYNQRQQRR
jgi:Cys-rich protein (TIGR01571 family)